jgi:hypothetical protein
MMVECCGNCSHLGGTHAPGSAGVPPACTPEAYPRWHARRRRAHPGQALLICAPEARAPMNLNGARAARLRCGSEGKMPALPEDNVNTYD